MYCSVSWRTYEHIIEKSMFSMGESAVEASAPRMSWADIALATAMRSVSGRELIVSITRDERIIGLFMTEEIFKLLVFLFARQS